MGFKEVRQRTDFIRISSSQIFISKSIMDNFLKEIERISIFLDEENKKIGIKPNPDGAYKISKGCHAHSVKCTSIGKVVHGYFTPYWDNKLGMLIFDYDKTQS